MKFLLLSVLLGCLLRVGTPYSMGAPDQACGDMIPRHGPSAQTSTPPYTITPNATVLMGGDRISVKIVANGEPMKGFLVQAQSSANQSPVGVFFTPLHKTLACGQGLNNAITHGSAQSKSEATMQWEAPSDFEGDVVFRSTIVKDKDTFWVGIPSEKVNIQKRSVAVDAAPPTTTTTTTTTTPPPLEGVSKLVEQMYDSCGSIKTCIGIPAKCVDKKKCRSVFSFTKSADNKYEFEMMGKLSDRPQYLAIGLSFDEKMGDDNVVVCESDGSSSDIYHTWNQGKSNVKITNPKKGLSQSKMGTYEGQLYCSFQRDSFIKLNGQEFDLDKSQYHVLIATGAVGGGQMQYHSPAGRLASSRTVVLGQTSKLASRDDRLMKTIHACLMIGAWVCAACTGILFARYYKKTWLKQRCHNIDQWFHMHRFLMVMTWCLTIAGSVVIVYDLNEFRVTNHSLVGVATVVLCFIQPFMAALRPHPGTKNRSIFNWFHWFVGNSAQILGIAAIFLGMELYYGQDRMWVKEVSWYILIVFIAFHILCHLILSVTQCVSDCKGQPEEDAFPMKDITDSRMALQTADEPRDAPGACLRKFIMALYLPVNWIATTLLILLVVFKRDQLEDQFTDWGIPPFWQQ